MTALDLTGAIVRDSPPLVGGSDDKPEPKRVRTKEARARQALRIAELERQGYTVVDNGCGLTVFNVRQDATSPRNKIGTTAVNIITWGE